MRRSWFEQSVEHACQLGSDFRVAARRAADLAVAAGARFDAEEPSGALLTLAAIERQAILDALKRTGGNQAKAAEQLGINRKTLSRRLKEHSS